MRVAIIKGSTYKSHSIYLQKIYFTTFIVRCVHWLSLALHYVDFSQVGPVLVWSARDVKFSIEFNLLRRRSVNAKTVIVCRSRALTAIVDA